MYRSACVAGNSPVQRAGRKWSAYRVPALAARLLTTRPRVVVVVGRGRMIQQLFNPDDVC